MTSFELNEVSVISMEASGDGYDLHAVGALDAFFGPPRCDAVLRPVFKQGLRRHWESKMILSQYSAKDRYRWFLGSIPG